MPPENIVKDNLTTKDHEALVATGRLQSSLAAIEKTWVESSPDGLRGESPALAYHVFAQVDISVSYIDAVPSPAIREVVDHDWSNRQMNYRLNQLDEVGLVETEDLKDSVHHYSQAPRACWLTESGWEAFDEWYRAVGSSTADFAELSEELSALEEGVGISIYESESGLPERKLSDMTAAPWSGEFRYLDADNLSERVDIVRSRQLYMLGLLWELKQTIEQTHDGEIEWEDYRRFVDEEVERRWKQLDM